MKNYFKLIIPIFITVFTYTSLTILFGSKGLYSMRFIETQRDSLISHVSVLQEIGEDLDSHIRNLTYDSNTIAIYAHELGYIYDNEGIIKLVNFNQSFTRSLNAGTPLKITKPHFLSDYICKTISISLGIIVIIFELLTVKKQISFKRGE